jgi:hypothetical protein
MNLRKLHEAATAGPWVECGRDVGHDKMVAEGRNPGDACGLGCEIDGPPEAWLRGQFHNHADAALIVALRNAASFLLDVVDVAREVAESGYPPRPDLEVTALRVSDALAALDAHLVSTGS